MWLNFRLKAYQLNIMLILYYFNSLNKKLNSSKHIFTDTCNSLQCKSKFCHFPFRKLNKNIKHLTTGVIIIILFRV